LLLEPLACYLNLLVACVLDLSCAMLLVPCAFNKEPA